MKLSYYDKFKCTADKCEITCCQEWKISVDEITEGKWKQMGIGDCICERDEEQVIKLNGHRKCPFLSENKLCNLVIKHGEDVIPHTCNIFPRQIHEFDNRTEYALVSCCPEVINLLYKTDINEMTEVLFAQDYDDMYRIRNIVIKQIIDSETAVLAMKKMFFMVLDMVTKDAINIDIYNDVYFKELEKAINDIYDNGEQTFDEVNELFLDIVENYRKQNIYVSYLEDIALLAERLSSTVDTEILDKYRVHLNEMHKHENIFKKYLISEFFADGLLDDSDIYDFTIMFQWFAIEYALIRHALFLTSIRKQSEIQFSDIRDYMVVISRMMGYNREDIYEYMEECFRNSIWEWGYFALLLA